MVIVGKFVNVHCMYQWHGEVDLRAVVLYLKLINNS